MRHYTINNTTLIFQIEKCQDVTLGYSTEKQCDKWPKTVCELNKVTRKRYTPETKCEKSRREVNISLYSSPILLNKLPCWEWYLLSHRPCHWKHFLGLSQYYAIVIPRQGGHTGRKWVCRFHFGGPLKSQFWWYQPWKSISERFY